MVKRNLVGKQKKSFRTSLHVGRYEICFATSFSALYVLCVRLSSNRYMYSLVHG